MIRINLLFSAIVLTLITACTSESDTSPSQVADPTLEIVIPNEGTTSPDSYDGMTLVWEDDFQGNSLNLSNWSYEIGTGTNGWGNNEIQYYRKENATLKEGHLVITAKKETFEGRSYTSSRLVTKDKKQFRYGRIDVRAVMPKGQGLWPALWMLGSNFETVGWPACGEIDIMEMIGGNSRENTVHGTVHWENNGTRAQYGGENKISSGTLADKFHVFSIVWDSTSIRWYIDNQQYHIIDTTPGELDEFRRNFFFIFNVAVGGDWPGSPDNTTTFPQHMIVDYVRVFQVNP